MMMHTTTTPHGSTLIALSDVLICPICGHPFGLVKLPGHDIAWECQSPACGKTMAPGTVIPVAAPACQNCARPHPTYACPEIRQALFAPAAHRCPSCDDPTDNAGLCDACREIADQQYGAMLRASGLIPLYDARELAALRWKDFPLFVRRLSAMTNAQLHRQAAAFVAYLTSYSPTDLTVAHVIETWRMQIASAAAVGMLEVAS